MIDELTDGLGDFGFDIDDDLLTEMEEAQKEVAPKAEKESKAVTAEKESSKSEDLQPDTEEEVEESPQVEETEEPEEEDSFLDDEKIFEIYGEESNPQVVRHYEQVKDYLLTDDDYEFKGNNLDEAYEQDVKNRNLAIANNLFESLPTPLQKIFSTALKNPEGITKETYRKMMEEGVEVFDNTYDESDEESVKEFIIKGLVQEGRDEDEAQSLVDFWEDKGKLLKEARLLEQRRDAKREEENIAKIQKDKQQKAEQEARQRTFYENINGTLKATKMVDKRQNLIKSYIFDRVDGTNDTPLLYTLKAIYQDPGALVTLADMLSYYDIDNKKWDMSKFEKQAVTAEVKKAKKSIEEKLAGTNAFGAKGSTRSKNVEFNWEDVDP